MLLFVLLWVAGLCGGYPAGRNIGFQAGYSAGLRSGANQKQILEGLTTVIYLVDDLVSPVDVAGKRIAGPPDFDSLIELITTTIDAATWDESGGPGSIKEFEPSRSLAITQSPESHQKIQRLFKDLRRDLSAKAGPVNSGAQPP